MSERHLNEFPDFGLTPAQRREAVLGHYYEYPGMDGPRGEIWCYTDAYSYLPGATVHLQVSTTASRFDIEIVRDGAVETPVFSKRGIDCKWQETPAQCSVVGCGWETTFAFKSDENWPSGAYRITLKAHGNDGQPIHCHHLFILRPAAGRKPGRILQVAATGTWTAYNTWGGSNHYQGITGPNGDQYATTVSIERPFCRGFVVLPSDAPRVPLEIVTPPAAPPRYPHMEWAYANGYSKKYTSSGWASYDSLFFRWAEREGYAVDLASQHELHFSPEILEGYDCVAFVGHDEYWTWEMRDAVDNYVDGGGRAARFAGNFMWQTRLEDNGKRQTCYIAPAPKTRSIAPLIRVAPAGAGKRLKPDGLLPKLSASMRCAGFMSAGVVAPRAACAVSRSIAQSIGPLREPASITAISWARKAMPSAMRLTGSTM